MEEEAIELGQKVQDSVNGAVGIVTAIARYLHGSTLVLIETSADQGEVQRLWTEAGRLATIGTSWPATTQPPKATS